MFNYRRYFDCFVLEAQSEFGYSYFSNIFMFSDKPLSVKVISLYFLHIVFVLCSCRHFNGISISNLLKKISTIRDKNEISLLNQQNCYIELIFCNKPTAQQCVNATIKRIPRTIIKHARTNCPRIIRR